MLVPNHKIGLGLITCDRPDFFKKSSNSISKIDCIKVVVDDGENKVETVLDRVDTDNPKSGVGKAKNKALAYLIDKGCEHIFLMEDDIEILDEKVFDVYIKASWTTGIKHFNFGLHGNHNKDLNGNITARKIINYPDETKIVLYPNVLGAFSYYHIDVLNKVGLMDEQFYNALEHVDHTYQIIKEGYHPYFRWFADVLEANDFLKDIVPDHQESKIRSEEDFIKNFFENHDRFVAKNKFAVVYGRGPVENNYTEEQVIENLKEIWKLYHQEQA